MTTGIHFFKLHSASVCGLDSNILLILCKTVWSFFNKYFKTTVNHVYNVCFSRVSEEWFRSHEDFVRREDGWTRLARTRWLSFSITRVEGVGNVGGNSEWSRCVRLTSRDTFLYCSETSSTVLQRRQTRMVCNFKQDSVDFRCILNIPY